MCFGFMGIQFGFAQNANVSRIFQTLGADYNNMTLFGSSAPYGARGNPLLVTLVIELGGA